MTKTMPEWLLTACRLILTVGLPIALTLTNVRLLMTPLFPQVEYGLRAYSQVDNYPGRLPDGGRHPFTQADRLFWALRSIAYILGDPAAGAIEAWKFSDEGRAPAGTLAPADSCPYYDNEYGARDCTYFYNDREVRHMVDVRAVTAGALWVWGLALGLSVAAAGLLLYAGRPAALRLGLLNGAVVTWIALIGLVLFMAVGFNQFFTLFHRVFFTGDTWLFLWSDSLIRLFPLQFWFDAFLFVGLATLAEAGLLGALAWRGLPAK
jgi:hypothetical protein